MPTDPQPASPASTGSPAPDWRDCEPARRLLAWNPGAVVAGEFARGELALTLAAAALPAVAAWLRDEPELRFDMLVDITCVDWLPAEPRFAVVYELYSTTRRHWLRLKVRTAASEPVPSLAAVWPSANWFEREIFDLFGVSFAGHPFLRRILMPDNWEGHPMRKDYPVEGYR
ncbi:MAG: NADH-quinone oxidoreductase subunit C [Terriglobales bacterium]